MSNADKIKELQAQIDELQAADNAFNALPKEYQLAITLHSTLCHLNHTDGCSWEYEFSKGKVEWHGHAHSRYLDKAHLIQAFCSRVGIKTEDAVELIKLMQGY